MSTSLFSSQCPLELYLLGVAGPSHSVLESQGESPKCCGMYSESTPLLTRVSTCATMDNNRVVCIIVHANVQYLYMYSCTTAHIHVHVHVYAMHIHVRTCSSTQPDLHS